MPPCGAKETAEFCREKRHCHDSVYRTAPFQNPATARTAGSCERTGATKAPVLSPAFSFVPRRASKPPHSRSQGSGSAGPALTLNVGTQAPHGPQSPQRPRGAALSTKALHNPSQAARIGCCTRGPDARSQAPYAFLREPAIFFTATQFLLVPPLEILTQNIENRRGADRNDFRVLRDFSPQRPESTGAQRFND